MMDAIAYPYIIIIVIIMMILLKRADHLIIEFYFKFIQCITKYIY